MGKLSKQEAKEFTEFLLKDMALARSYQALAGIVPHAVQKYISESERLKMNYPALLALEARLRRRDET